MENFEIKLFSDVSSMGKAVELIFMEVVYPPGGHHLRSHVDACG